MRFNQKELAFIALQPAETFDLQGLLWLREKDGYFKWQRTECKFSFCFLKILYSDTFCAPDLFHTAHYLQFTVDENVIEQCCATMQHIPHSALLNLN